MKSFVFPSISNESFSSFSFDRLLTYDSYREYYLSYVLSISNVVIFFVIFVEVVVYVPDIGRYLCFIFP
jgi:hypothetical protein